jgi:hypothetical protein
MLMDWSAIRRQDTVAGLEVTGGDAQEQRVRVRQRRGRQPLTVEYVPVPCPDLEERLKRVRRLIWEAALRDDQDVACVTFEERSEAAPEDAAA